MSYSADPYNLVRRPSRSVWVGSVPIGGEHPLCLQSMTTSRAADVDDSVHQTLRLVEAGSQLVRITVPQLADARALADLAARLRAEHCDVPIVADVHFSSEVALEAARVADKIRINPGNYSDTHEAPTEELYQAALASMGQRLEKLFARCRERRVALRVGVNHGSLAPRVVARWGAGPEGMVQAALEVVALARQCDFHDLVISLKASDPRVMVIANRLLATRLDERGWNYPIHLGVTEAGDGEDGRIKSAMGIGALLADGIGDTIRVSLTEAPERELPVCRQIAARTKTWYAQPKLHCPWPLGYDPLHPVRRGLDRSLAPLAEHGALLACCLPSVEMLADEPMLSALGCSCENGSWQARESVPDLILCAEGNPACVPTALRARVAMLHEADSSRWATLDGATSILWQDVQSLLEASERPASLRNDAAQLLILSDTGMGLGRIRAAVSRLIAWGIQLPVLLHRQCLAESTPDELPVAVAMECGIPLLDNLAEGIVLQHPQVPMEVLRSVGFSVLQAAGLRRVKADFIACPGCGRTLFDLQETLARVRSATAHLRHLRIGVMGCIVNGPGEMADADYGYVGAGPGRITLYKGQCVVKRNVPSGRAIDELVALIKEHGDWREP